ncbi:uromodulin-like, partial [Kryptolebias marmoratus]|uniref:uromodulin-like n=1 Tax=Kryptolebias marmoratus TaxID=37003 RepID=UPI0007F91C42
TTTTLPPPPTTTTPPLFHSICTVTGPTVIDFSGHLVFVKDRCEYYLLQIQGLSVVGRFRERRLRDVSFLDSVTLEVNGVHIRLEQGGRVLVDGLSLILGSSTQVVVGVELSRDQTGVTAIVHIEHIRIIIFFDGNTVLIFVEVIHVEVFTALSPQGLCQNSSSEAKLPDCSYMSCDRHYDDHDKHLICPNSTKSCYHLKEAPFTSCPIDPEPYIDACTELLSIYPAVDGLNCQFLKAYAKACSLYSNTPVVDWRSKTKCHPHEAFCYNRTCLDHEFCAEKSYGETACFCRAHFACKHHYYYPDPVCKKNYASLTLYNCLLEEKGIDYTVLHLNHPECRGELNQMDNTVTFSFKGDTCGTEIMDNGTHIIYKNTIMNENVTGVITRHKMVKIDISCYQTQPGIMTKTFTIKDGSYKDVIVPGPWNYTLCMRVYTDYGCKEYVDSNTPIHLNQKVWVKLFAKWLDEDVVVLVTEDCWATDQPSPTAEPRHDLIKDGCPVDPTVMIRGNGKAVFNTFGFKMFEFVGGSDQIYLHCKVRLCVKTSNNNCVPACGRNRRRRSATFDSPALITMGWTS